MEGIPVFDTVEEAVAQTGANASMVFVPARFATDAIYEAVAAGIATVVCIAEGLPAHEMLRVYNYIRPHGVTMIGPNCPGVLSPGKANVGIIPAEIFHEGSIGLVSRSGTLTYQIGHELTQLGLGNSTIVGIGGDPIVGSSFIDILAKFEADPETEYVVMVGEIGGDEEEKAAAYIEQAMTKPVVAYIAGFTAPPGKTMGHAAHHLRPDGSGQKAALEARHPRGHDAHGSRAVSRARARLTSRGTVTAVRAFVTGGTGFIGGTLVRALCGRGDEVVALARSTQGAGALRELGCAVVEGDLASVRPETIAGCDAVFHVAALNRTGVPPRWRERMWESNVRGTERVLDAAVAAGAARIVHVSTVAVLGDTHGQVLDETAVGRTDFLSLYDETKHAAHFAAAERAAAGAPGVTAMPAVVYGPDNGTQLGVLLGKAMRGRLPAISFAELGICAVHVDDVAQGLLLACERGRTGEAYLLAGERTTLGELFAAAAAAAGRRPPRSVPAALVRLAAPLGPLLVPFGMPSNLREAMRASHKVTLWASDAKARAELGFAPRGLADGVADLAARSL